MGRRGVGPRCSFCGTSTGPFKEVGGLFTLLMCGACQAVRRSGPGLQPREVVVHANVLEPYLQWACPLAGCDFRAELPWPLERHAAAEHPEWTATFEGADQAQRADLWRVVYRRSDA
jgi:hypothetical protein